MSHLWSLLFGLRAPVSRKAYAIAGFTLMALKYGIDATIFRFYLDRAFMPWDYLNPLFTSRWKNLDGNVENVFLAMVVIALPFLWIGASMSVRRCRDAGLPAYLGLFFFVPLVNYLMMVLLCFLPSAEQNQPYRQDAPSDPVPASLVSALLAAAIGAAFAMAMVAFSVYLLGDYGRPLFLGSPFVVGAVAGYLANRPRRVSVWASQVIAQLAVLIAGSAILLFALEGILCLAMAWPLAMVMAALGALLGHAVAGAPAIADPRTVSPLLVLALAWPLLGLAEPPGADAPLRAVVTRQIIDAPPEKVWPNVIGFSELPPATELLFRLGVSHPQRARIVGTGVGAVRYCEFSTGPFVEPITAWEPPTRLAFDVAAQPPAMRELSPYQISAPHLDGFLQSRRGEFQLHALPDGRTELVGTTWYEVHIGPPVYWQVYADLFIHKIHRRVLRHIQTLSEGSAG